ncbi:PTS glucitol/sorbitol transporter subunit IIA [Domibacillus sp. DTU_2020_1001157_1_SI_ALB_TIR_016]|uniref:PTS glucitol/sorbitol transporter subunit IIA n=1 Tax=Domibacillus sp. DTU_2020_1001157_1_SI_ALB_TIR_016 TaxID=3077789 RepID=UPI0028EC7782|nr:PTS glucitol/sorbitol transporter subunit IIA [Domibacillus sp. DTU_2020_1001157_1_SI_ALB_TIR_016]WNS78277.1 PTS glucitol/sorbitol transporter subunit IIA [Domibacillus sp. DTU_2020_1001157_1_SI_ALB_TIR_016]
MQTIYETQINGLGSEVAAFLGEKMFILFGANAPSELADYCLLIDVNDINDEIEKGDTFVMGGQPYTITAVGDVVKKNLGSLGHITLKFDGAETADLPGTLHLEKSDIQVPAAGTTIQIVKK